MAIPKSENAAPVSRKPVRVESDASSDKDAEVVHSKLQPADELSFDDGDYGGDPYNTTGKFTVIKQD